MITMKIQTILTFSLLLHDQACRAFQLAYPLIKDTPSRTSFLSHWMMRQDSVSLASSKTDALSSPLSTTVDLESKVGELKRVLEREYVSFFDPMESEYYSPSVTFDDPLTSLSGVDAYRRNVDMLAARTLMGKVLFRDAGIVLHSVTGGSVDKETGAIEDIVTRWTLRLTAQILPWQPTARFSGISVYQVSPGGPRGVQIMKQTDYWDSINLKSDGSYQKVDKSIGIADFLDQLKPSEFIAPSAGPELPYNLLRRGKGYEVRRYPSYVAVETPYERRDEGFLTLGSLTSGLNPLSPAVMTVTSDAAKVMMWPVAYAPPGTTTCTIPTRLEQRITEYEDVEIRIIPEKVIAVGSFSDASVEHVVRRADRELRAACSSDGLKLSNTVPSVLQFAQYDAVYTMGKRRGEVWIELEDGAHPWSQ